MVNSADHESTFEEIRIVRSVSKHRKSSHNTSENCNCKATFVAQVNYRFNQEKNGFY